MKYAKGFRLALVTAGISGVSVFINSFAVKAVGDALVLTTAKNLMVGLMIGLMLIGSKINWQEIKKSWLKLVLIGVIGGSLPFYLFFQGLLLSSAAMAGLIHKSLVLWVGLWAASMLKEKINGKQWLVLAGVAASSLLIGGMDKWQWGRGEWLVLAATVLWAGENILAKQVLKTVTAEVVGGARMMLGGLLLALMMVLSGRMGVFAGLGGSQWGWILITAGLLFGYVISWYRALRLAPVTLVTTVLSLGAVVTNVLSSIFVTHFVNIDLLFQSVLLVIFTVVFVKNSRNGSAYARNVALR